jgi:pyroglutamyl-peptidase
MAIILAAFEPFDGRRRNRSWELARRVRPRPGLEVVQLPVDFARLRQEIPALAARASGGLLLLGESSRPQLCVEQVALNLVDSSHRADNAGARPRAETVVAGAPLALRVAWDARAVAERVNQIGAGRGPLVVASFHAGTFACNAALYLALHARGAGAPVAFIHVPRRGWPSGPRLGALVHTVEACLDMLVGG